uniref:Uncharacterized protein n=1 Tax=Oryza rufipogon TaxID=4529 RepID=A0A0E0R645_ORYRU
MAAGAWRIGALDAPRHRRWLAQDAARCGVRAVQLYGDGGGGGCRLLASRVSNNRTRRHTGHWGPMNGDGGGRSMHGDGAGSRLSLESRTTGGGGARGWNLEVASGVRVLTGLWRVGVGQNFGGVLAPSSTPLVCTTGWGNAWRGGRAWRRIGVERVEERQGGHDRVLEQLCKETAVHGTETDTGTLKRQNRAHDNSTSDATRSRVEQEAASHAQHWRRRRHGERPQLPRAYPPAPTTPPPRPRLRCRGLRHLGLYLPAPRLDLASRSTATQDI